MENQILAEQTRTAAKRAIGTLRTLFIFDDNFFMDDETKKDIEDALHFLEDAACVLPIKVRRDNAQ